MVAPTVAYSSAAPTKKAEFCNKYKILCLCIIILNYGVQIRLKCYCDQKKHFNFFFGFRNFVYETIAMRNFRP